MDVFDLFATIGLDTSGYESGLSNASGLTQSFGDRIKNVFGTVAKVGAAALTAASGAVTAFGIASVSTGKQFDQSMSQVAATMGKTVDEIQELRDFAMEMGAKTAFSATQAADALNYMALAGYDAETSMSMLPNVLNLAAAGGMELASASDMITDSQSALGLTLDETSALVDQMASAASNANASVAQMGDAILTVGGTAKVLGGGLMTLSNGEKQTYSATTELNQVLGLLADNGVKGAEGGTALRNIILSLTAPTDKAAKTLENLGVKILDNSGNMRSMKDIFADLNGAMSDMSEGKKTEVLNEIFNKVDLKSVNALMNTNVERWDKLAGAIENSKYAAEKMADVQLDNLAGDITLWQSALEGAQIIISDILTPSLREFVQLGTSGLTTVTDAFKQANEAQNLAESFRDAEGAIRPVSDIAEDLGKRFSKLSAVVPYFSFRDAAGELGKVSDLADGLYKTVSQMAYDDQMKFAKALGIDNLDDFYEILDPVNDLQWKLEKIIQSADAAISGDMNILQSLFPDYEMDEILSWFDGSEEGLAQLQTAVESVDASQMTDGFTAAMEALPGVIDDGIAMIMKSIPQVIEIGGQILGAVISGIINNLPVLADGAIQVAQTFVNYLFESVKNALDSIGILEPLVESFSGVGEAFDRIVESISPLIEMFTEWAGNAETAQVTSALLEETLTFLGESISVVTGFIADIVEGAAAFITWLTEGSNGADALAAAITAVVAGFAAFQAALVINTAIGELKTAIDGAKTAFAGFNSILSANPIMAVIAVVAALAAGIIYLWNTNEDFRDAVGPIWEAIKGFFVGAWEKIKSAWDAAQPYFSEIWTQIQKTFSVVSEVLGGFFSRAWQVIQIIWSVVSPWFAMIWHDIERIFSVAEAVLGGFFSTAWAAIKTVWDAAIGFFQNIWNTIDSIFSVVEAVLSGDFSAAWEAIKGVFSGWTNYFEGLWEDLQGVFSNAWRAFKDIAGNIVSGLWAGLNEKWSWLTGKASGLVGKLMNVFTGKSGFDEHSPSKWAMRVGEYVMIGLVNGMEKEQSEAEKIAEKTASNIYNGLSKWADRITNPKGLAEGMSIGWLDEMDAIRDKITESMNFSTIDVTAPNIPAFDAQELSFSTLLDDSPLQNLLNTMEKIPETIRINTAVGDRWRADYDRVGQRMQSGIYPGYSPASLSETVTENRANFSRINNADSGGKNYTFPITIDLGELFDHAFIRRTYKLYTDESNRHGAQFIEIGGAS